MHLKRREKQNKHSICISVLFFCACECTPKNQHCLSDLDCQRNTLPKRFYHVRGRVHFHPPLKCSQVFWCSFFCAFRLSKRERRSASSVFFLLLEPVHSFNVLSVFQNTSWSSGLGNAYKPRASHAYHQRGNHSDRPARLIGQGVWKKTSASHCFIFPSIYCCQRKFMFIIVYASLQCQLLIRL